MPLSHAQQLESVGWPFVERVRRAWGVPGIAVAVVTDGDQVHAQGFGSRDRRTGDRVRPDTVFHLASVSKTVVATAAFRMAEAGLLDLDAPVADVLTDLTWADPRAARITPRQLLSHTSGLGDVSDYGWHEPQTDDEALARFAERVAGWQLTSDPGEKFAYSNAGYELVGHLLARVADAPFEAVMADQALCPAGMFASTFLPGNVPDRYAARGHVCPDARALDGIRPYTRQHAPSSSLHADANDLGLWMAVHLGQGAGVLEPATHEELWRPQVESDWGAFYQRMAHGWFHGSHRDRPTLAHSGEDPGFDSVLVLLPEEGLGVAVLVNANTAPIHGIAMGLLDVLLGEEPTDPVPPVALPVSAVLAEAGVAAAIEAYGGYAAEDPPGHDLSGAGFEAQVWGAIEMHRGDTVADVLEVWRTVQPDCSEAWAMTGWAQLLDGDRDAARGSLERALELDADNEDAATFLAQL